MSEKIEKRCTKCKKVMGVAQNFYTSKRTDLYPDNGVVDECKKCFTMHVNIYEPSTFLSLLEKIDIPYIESEWNSLIDKYGQDTKTTSTAIFGRYLAKMKLKQFAKYSYTDTNRFVEEEKMRELKAKADKLAQINKYRDAQNSGAIYQNLEELDLTEFTEEERKQFFPTAEEIMSDEDFHQPEDDLTKEDKQYLLAKWGRTYTISECIKLEKLYIEMMDSYDIRTASHIDYLLKICRISLKIDQALEVNDIDGFQKMSKVYDLLMKSAKFTAAQNKEQSDNYTDAIGILIGMCEEEGFVPKYYEERQDVVDFTLKDMNEYLRKLVMNEMNLGNMIEVHLQKMQQEEDKEEDEMTDEDDDILILTEKEEALLGDEDYEEFNSMLEEEVELDENMLQQSGEMV